MKKSSGREKLIIGREKLIIGRKRLIEDAKNKLRNITPENDVNDIDDVSLFECFVDRLEFHETYEKEKVDFYHKVWRKVIIVTPLLASIATTISCYIVGQEFPTGQPIYWHSLTEQALPITVALLEFIVATLSTLVGAVLPAKQFSEAANNLIKLDELLFNTVVEISNENKYPKGEGDEANYDRAVFWETRYHKLSDIGRAMISEDFVHKIKEKAV